MTVTNSIIVDIKIDGQASENRGKWPYFIEKLQVLKAVEEQTHREGSEIRAEGTVAEEKEVAIGDLEKGGSENRATWLNSKPIQPAE